MDFIISLIIFVVFLLITKHFLATKKSEVGNIPCLRHVPYFGSLPFMPGLNGLHVFMAEKSKKLGNVIGFYLSNRFIVVLNGRDAIHEAFVKQSIDYADRPPKTTVSFFNPKSLGIAEHPYDEHFKKYHGLALDIMKEFGFGKSIMEDRITIEVNDFINSIDKLEGKCIEADKFLKVVIKSVGNVMLGVLFGNRMNYEDTESNRNLSNFSFLANNSLAVMSVVFFPFLKWIPKYNNSVKQNLECEKEIYKYFEKQIDNHSDNCFISEFILKDGVDYDREQLNFTLRDLFAAGMDTTVSTLQFIFIFLADRLDLQEELQSQMDKVVDKNEMITLKDKGNLPLLEAIILESMRFKTLVPIAIAHMTTKDTVVQGIQIPANTWVLPNLYSANMDSTLWKDPQIFRPSRFLDDKGTVINRNLMFAFSLGKRACFGEILARQELFLFTGNLLHLYSIFPPQGQTKVAYTEKDGIVVRPENYTIRFLKR